VQRAWHGAVFVGGQFAKPAAGGTIGVRDKASGEIFATASLASEADIDAAAAAANSAQPAWTERTYAKRAVVLRDAAAALTGRAKPMRELIMRETGCIAGKADYEVAAAVSELIEAAGLASRATGDVLPTSHAGRFSLSERIPVGLVGVITPWNFPLVLGMRVIAPALALGNVVADVKRTSRLWTEEIFAPIAPVVVVDDEDEAVAVANDTSYGLVDSVLTGDLARGVRIARRLRAGMVHVNDATPQDEALAPFGGIGQSGLGGRSGGDANIEEYTERRWLTVNPGRAHYPY
jgi:acyl-CoA reductase-like NAD-dependent aldehyde dehydrogenase